MLLIRVGIMTSSYQWSSCELLELAIEDYFICTLLPPIFYLFC